MQADWEYEVGGDAPVIDADWAGFVDLHLQPELAGALPEAIAFPALAMALVRLNLHRTPVWTSKCDFFAELAPEEFDARELDAAPEEAAFAAACYIDILPADDASWTDAERTAAACKQACTRLGAIRLTCCGVELVVRRASSRAGELSFGVTAYATGCGPTRNAAAASLARCLEALVDAVCPRAIASGT